MIDINKYKPSQKILDKLEGYRSKGSRVNVKAITNPDKLFTYYYAANLMGWGDLANDIWDAVDYNTKKEVLEEIDKAVTADASLEDTRSKDTIALQDVCRNVARYLAEKNLSYTFKSRAPHYNELEKDRRNGRCWTLAYTLTVEGTLNIDFANHTNEGGGTYGYSIDHSGWNMLSKKELETRIIEKIEASGLCGGGSMAEEFKEYENLWEVYEEDPYEWQYNKPRKSFIKTFGNKKYDLADYKQLHDWVEANVQFQMKRYPNRYTHKDPKTGEYPVGEKKYP